MRTLLVLSLTALLAANAHAEEPKLHGNLDAARAIVKADLDFGALAQKEGTAKAFRDSMDAVKARSTAAARNRRSVDATYAKMGGDAPDESTLVWHPVEAFAAKSGDMGVTRGRWTATSKPNR